MKGDTQLKLWALAAGGVVSGLVLLTVPHFDKSEFTKLTHVSGRIDEVLRLSRPGSPNSSVSVTLSGGLGRHRIRIETYEWHPVKLAGLSLGAVVDAWVEEGPSGEMFAWQIERDGEVLVGYRDRLETSRRLQHGLESVGWPLLAGGLLLSLLALRGGSNSGTMGSTLSP